jgi:hypothetical protein
MLSKVAQEAGIWIIGGSIPEKEEGSEKVWNTATVWDPEGTSSSFPEQTPPSPASLKNPHLPGNLVAKHRKVHLYDCDFPGGVYFMVRGIAFPSWLLAEEDVDAQQRSSSRPTSGIQEHVRWRNHHRLHCSYVTHCLVQSRTR